MPTRRTLLAAAPLLATPQLLRAAGVPRPPLVGRIALDGQRLFTSAQINGEKLLFVIDTGTTQNKIRPEIAARLKLAAFGNTQGGGLGAKSTFMSMHIARDVIVGGIVRQPLMTFESYDFGRGMRADVAGLLAAGVLTGYPTTLDFVKGEWSLYLDGLPELAGYKPLPTRLQRLPGDQSDRIFVDATFEGTPLRLMLDTGAPRNLLLFPQTVAKFKLFEGNRPFTEVLTAGFGGRSRYPSRVMRANALQIGPYRFEELAYTAMDPREPRKDFGGDGLIGIDLIGLFDLAIDPRKNRMLVRRNALAYVEREAPPKR
ncbi:hypothetical protein SPAN111604_08375 [Sphingomonas antarctica]|uniref:aspartyl protease family protein n=1 Tax=Sphingomonas antarctica TaxID=2040274 RepID=UPI0039EC005B